MDLRMRGNYSRENLEHFLELGVSIEMKTALIIFLVFMTGLTHAGVIELTIKNIPNSNGQIMIGIYNKAEGFTEVDKTFRNKTVPAKKGTMTIKIEGIPNGDYALSVFHDQNANGKLDKNFFGVPTEYYGFSNDARGTFGPPDFSECVVKVKGLAKTSLSLY